MATTVVTKSSINVVTGGQFSVTAAGTVSQIVLTSGQYAILNITNFTLTGSGAGASSAALNISGNTVLSLATSAAITQTLVDGKISGSTAYIASATPITLYITNTCSTVVTLAAGATVNIQGNYIVFANT